jgi:hypothetical protein
VSIQNQGKPKAQTPAPREPDSKGRAQDSAERIAQAESDRRRAHVGVKSAPPSAHQGGNKFNTRD